MMAGTKESGAESTSTLVRRRLELRGARRCAAVLLVLFGGAACGGPDAPAREPDLTADPPLGGAEGAATGAAAGDLQRGIAYIKAEKYAEAKGHLERAVEKDPKSAEAAYYLGLVQEKTGDRQAAEESYRRALSLDAKFAEASENLGALYLDDPPQPERAIEVLKEGLAKSPDNPRLHQNLAYAYGLQRDFGSATKEYETAIAKADSLQLRFAYGSMLFEAKEYDKASEQLKKVLAGTGDDAPMLATVGRMLAHSKAYGDCVKAFDRAIALKKDDPELYVRRGTCRHELKDEAAAMADFKAAIKANPSFAAAHYYLGLSLIASRQRMAGMDELDKAIKLGQGTPFEKLAREKLEEAKKKQK